jgi:hypothetical protein
MQVPRKRVTPRSSRALEPPIIVWMSGSADYNPKIIERFADQLLAKADSVRVGFAVFGGIFGVVVGAVPLTPLESVWPIPGRFGVATMLLGTLIGVLVGYVIGEGRAFRYRVEAQRALFQLDVERRVAAAVTRSVTEALAKNQQPAPVQEPPAQAPPAAPPLVRPAPQPTATEPALRPPAATPSPKPPDTLPPLSPAASA